MSSICAVQPRILIADDQPDLIDALRLLLKGEGIHVDSVTSPEAALAAIAAGSFDLLLMDLNYTGDTTSGREGIDLLSRVQALDRELPDRRHDRLGLGRHRGRGDAARRAQLRPEALGQRASSSRSCGPKSTPGARGASRSRSNAASSTRRAASSASCCPPTMPPLDGWEVAVSWQPASGVGGDCFDAIAFGPARARPVDRRRRRQGHSCGAADVEPAGRRPRLRHRHDRAGRALPAGQPHPLRPHRRRPVHLVLLLRRRQRRLDADLRQRRPLPSDPDSRRRHRGAARHGRRRPRRVSGRRLRAGTRLAPRAAIASSSTPTGSPTCATRPTKSSATSGSSTWRSPIGRAARPPCRPGSPMPSTAFSDGRFQDDATLIVMAAE